MGLSFEEKLVLKDLIQPELELKRDVLKELYNSGNQKDINIVLNEIAILNSVLNKLNIKL